MYYEPILVQCHISIPPENVRKPKVLRGYRNVTLDQNRLKSSKTMSENQCIINQSFHQRFN